MKAYVYVKFPPAQQVGGKIFKLVFAGDIPFVPRVGDKVGILEGYAVHRVEDIYYSIPNNCVEIYTACVDHGNEYPEVEYPED